MDPAFQQEAVVKGSILPGGDFSTRIYRDADNVSRGVWEFYLPTLPDGGVYTAATLAYTINQTSEGPGIALQLQFFSYAGNGRFEPSDAQMVQVSEGKSPLLFHDVSWSWTHSLNASCVNTILSGGSNWHGLVAWQETYGCNTGIGRGDPLQRSGAVRNLCGRRASGRDALDVGHV